jgi:hypothetical protein
MEFQYSNLIVKPILYLRNHVSFSIEAHLENEAYFTPEAI